MSKFIRHSDQHRLHRSFSSKKKRSPRLNKKKTPLPLSPPKENETKNPSKLNQPTSNMFSLFFDTKKKQKTKIPESPPLLYSRHSHRSSFASDPWNGSHPWEKSWSKGEKKTWPNEETAVFYRGKKKTAAGVYFCAIHVFNGLFFGNPGPFCERCSGFCTNFVVYHSVGEYVYNFQRRRLVAWLPWSGFWKKTNLQVA